MVQLKRFAPQEWNIYEDQMIKDMKMFRPDKGNNAVVAARKSHGKEGIESLGSLILAMESSAFVLTGKSNWSRLINELQRTILYSNCSFCTRVVDLSPSQWE